MAVNSPMVLTTGLGNTINRYNSTLEARDSTVDDPYALHYEKGMKSWRVALNSWSLDGLPGLLRDRERATPDIMKGARDDSNLRIPLKPDQRRPTREVTCLVVGLALGATFTAMALQGKRVFSTLSV